MTDSASADPAPSSGASAPVAGLAGEATEAPPAKASVETQPGKSGSDGRDLIARCNGVFAVRKPVGFTSADVVARVKATLERQLAKYQAHGSHVPEDAPEDGQGRPEPRAKDGKQKFNRRRKGNDRSFTLKVGHGGTLDPLASGCLVIGVGTGTKQLAHFLSCTKEYVADGRFGAETDTYDIEGKVTRLAKPQPGDPVISMASVAQCLEKYKGEIMQIPPLYSALKMDGKRLYEYAREGKPLPDGRKVEARKVTVDELELLEFRPSPAEAANPGTVPLDALHRGDDADGQPDIAAKDVVGAEFQCRIVSSGGFYVRSLIHDVGQDLGSAAFMTQLTRTRQGRLKLEDALEVGKIDLQEVVDAIERHKA
ncbi:putative tRNA pseudouridine synthase 1-like protein [Hyaloraphidium curvatum]|nr:putative tRNA pseudouridine synthase 1-like protein [Hyaloraphidium curvatum]